MAQDTEEATLTLISGIVLLLSTKVYEHDWMFTVSLPSVKDAGTPSVI